MTWIVNWLPAAEQELAQVWLTAPDRNSVTRAAHTIDQILRRDPENAGESRPNNRRILFVSPLGVIFRVLPDDRRVDVVHVWRF